MNNIENIEMSEFWNGNGGKKWINFQERLKTNLFDFGLHTILDASFNQGEQVLDIGCGCGHTTQQMSFFVGPYGHVHGIDISDLLLNQFDKNLNGSTQKNVSFECADAQSHNFKSNYFDVAFSQFGVMFFNDPVAAFTNIRKSLRPKGRLVFICWQEINSNQWVKLPLEIVEKYIPLPSPDNPEEPGAFSFGDANRISRILTEAGFSGISIKSFDAEFNVGATIDEAVDFLTQIGPANNAMEVEGVDKTSKVHITSNLREELLSHTTKSGVKLNASTWIVTAFNK